MVNNYLNPSKYPNAPSELPSIVRLEEPIKHLEISAICCQEEYAIEQAARIKRTIDSNFEYAIELGVINQVRIINISGAMASSSHMSSMDS